MGIMRNVEILDCTLRDGGYINDNVFGKDKIIRIVEGLKKSGVDLIEYGYLEDRKPINEDRTEYRTFDDLSEIAKKEKGNILMLLGEKYDIEKLPEASNDDCYLRITFHKKNADAGISKVQKILEKGYKVFIQPTVTMSYTDDELAKILEICNELKPVSVAIVDTFGQMTPDDVVHKVRLFDEVLDRNIAISFHAHNNLQNAYANAIKFIESANKNRRLIIDTSLFGMGRGAGNLPTELMMGYLNNNFGKQYDVDMLLGVIDDVILGYKEKNSWGYSLPYYLSGIHGVHPSYILSFMKRKTLSSKDIKALLDMISSDKKVEFDEEYARGLYTAYNNREINDNVARTKLNGLIREKKILLVGPGNSLNTEKDKIWEYVNKDDPYIISVNGEYAVRPNAVFFSSRKRYEEARLNEDAYKILCTSNIREGGDGDCLVFNYVDYLAKEGGVFDNALLMILNILNKIGIREVTLAGFDGYDVGRNFYKSSLELLLDKNYTAELNKVIRENVDELRSAMQIKSITSSKNI